MKLESLRPIGHVTVAEAATTSLFNAIVDGTLPAGTHLRLKELAERFGLSMMPMREALRRLEHLGLVEIEPHRGAFVRPKTLDDLQSTYQTRLLLEGEATARAAGNVSAQQEQVARRALEDLTLYLTIGDTEHARDAHERFHFAIYEAAGSPWLVRSIMPLWRNAERYRLESMRPSAVAKRRAREHDAILDAVLAGDPQTARATMDEHLRYSMELAVAAFPEFDDTAAEPRVPDEEVLTGAVPTGSDQRGGEVRSW